MTARYVVIRHIPGYLWVQLGVTTKFAFQWNVGWYRGLVRRFQLGPFVLLTLPKSQRQWDDLPATNTTNGDAR